MLSSGYLTRITELADRCFSQVYIHIYGGRVREIRGRGKGTGRGRERERERERERMRARGPFMLNELMKRDLYICVYI